MGVSWGPEVVGAHREPPWVRRINLTLGPAGFGVCSEVRAHFALCLPLEGGVSPLFRWKGVSLPGLLGLGVQMTGICDFIIPTLRKHLLTLILSVLHPGAATPHPEPLAVGEGISVCG